MYVFTHTEPVCAYVLYVGAALPLMCDGKMRNGFGSHAFELCCMLCMCFVLFVYMCSCIMYVEHVPIQLFFFCRAIGEDRAKTDINAHNYTQRTTIKIQKIYTRVVQHSIFLIAILIIRSPFRLSPQMHSIGIQSVFGVRVLSLREQNNLYEQHLFPLCSIGFTVYRLINFST